MDRCGVHEVALLIDRPVPRTGREATGELVGRPGNPEIARASQGPHRLAAEVTPRNQRPGHQQPERAN